MKLEIKDAENIVESLLASNKEQMLIYLLATFIAILIVYFHSRIKKSGELTEINNNFEKYLSQQETLVKQTEQIKKSLEKETIEYQIKLHAYNEKSVEAINNIYISLIDLRNKIKEFALNPGNDNKSSAIKEIYKFRDVFDINRLWVPNNICNSIEEVSIKMENKFQKFMIANTRAESLHVLSDDQINKVFDVQDAFYDFISTQLDTIFKDLVNEISGEISR